MITFGRPHQDLQHIVTARVLLVLLLGAGNGSAWASVAAAMATGCNSEKQPESLRLVERFINADCASCWQDTATPHVRPTDAVLDWVAPGAQAQDAPLAAVASRETLDRLEALKMRLPAADASSVQLVKKPEGASLRVAHGVALSGYMGVSIQFKPPPFQKGRHWTGWLAMVEMLPAGTEGTLVARNLVRNVLQPLWNQHTVLLNKDRLMASEMRVMSVPAGADPDRLQVIGWVENAQGDIVVAARSACGSP